MRMKFSPKTVLALIVFFIILVSIPLAVFQVKQRQEIRKEAFVEGGAATISLSPSEGNYDIDETFTVGVNFNTAGEAISAVAMRITYDTPEVEASNIQINNELPREWSCPVQDIYPEDGVVKIDISCVYMSVNGYSTTTDTLLITFNLVANETPAINPTDLDFDPSETKITRKSDAQDILGTPISPAGSYMIGVVIE